MLSSPNRYARDWITKALVQLLSGHLDVAASLVERFAKVNDPYVLERLITVAYGAVLRGGPMDTDKASQVAVAVEDFVFARLDELIPDALMIDAARGIVEWAVARSLRPEASLATARPPYGFRPPGNPSQRRGLKRAIPTARAQPTRRAMQTSIYPSSATGTSAGMSWRQVCGTS